MIKFTAAEKRARYNVLLTWWLRDTKVFLSAKKIALIISNWLNQNFAHGKSAYMFGKYRNHQSPGSRPLQKF